MGNKLIQLINLCLDKNIPFVSFRLPGESDIKTWIQLSGKFNFFEQFNEVANKAGFVYAPFHRKTNFPIVFFEPELVFENEDFEDSLIPEISEKAPMYPEYKFELPVSINKNEYLEQSETFIRSFNKDFTKAVLSRAQIENKPENFDAGSFFINLQKAYPNAFCHLINIPGTGCWTGASPETLLRIDDTNAQTISLAGTQPFQEKNIRWQEKELEEQQIVTDYIERVFKKLEIKNYKKEKVQNLQAGNAVHLATTFSFDKSIVENQLGQFISELHPTPAVCGLPKEKALDLILQTEKHNREYYAGFCGPINHEDKTNLFVNLRCMKILPDKLALFVGGGLTAKSDALKEWEETSLKANTLMNIL
ncbi:MAG: isochorismate synthase [Bacteroidales bacterium]